MLVGPRVVALQQLRLASSLRRGSPFCSLKSSLLPCQSFLHTGTVGTLSYWRSFIQRSVPVLTSRMNSTTTADAITNADGSAAEEIEMLRKQVEDLKVCFSF